MAVTAVTAVTLLTDHDPLDRQPVRLRKLEIPTVVRRHGHHGPRAIASQHVVPDPDGHLLARQRVHRVRPSEDPRLCLGQLGPLQIRLSRRGIHVLVHGRPRLGSHARRRHQRMLRRDHDVRRPEERIRARRVHLDHVPIAARHLERHGGPL